MPRRPPIPITLVAGPKGAGKTTLINRMLGDPALADSAVILNDFGEVALASAPVEEAADGYIALGSGCVCCTVRGALTDALERLVRDLDNGRLPSLARVIIEADEAADPAAILGAVARHPYLSLRFVADGIIAVLDATTMGTTLAGRADTVRQVAMADVVALSRLAPERGVVPVIGPSAIVDAATVSPPALVGLAFDAAGDLDAWFVAIQEETSRPRRGEAARIHAFAVSRRGAIPIAALDRFLEYFAALQGQNLVRVRGVVATGSGERVVVEGYGGFFQPPTVFDAPAGDRQTRFSVVARDLDQKTFEGYLDAFLNEARIDTPDRQALIDNPLAIAGFSARSGRQ